LRYAGFGLLGSKAFVSKAFVLSACLLGLVAAGGFLVAVFWRPRKRPVFSQNFCPPLVFNY
jgi:hypothetical protein